MDADAFKARREALGYTQAELGTLLETHLRTIRRWEHGDAKIPHSVELALRYLSGETRPATENPPHE